MSRYEKKFFMAMLVVVLCISLVALIGCKQSSDSDDDDSDSSTTIGVYTIGGANDARSSWYSSVWRYSPDTNTWESRTSASYDIAKYASVIKDKDIYVFGGEIYSGSSTAYTDKLWKYNTSTGTTTELSIVNAPAARVEAAAVVYANKIYVFGGVNSSSGYDQNLYIYDIDSNSWTTLAASGVWPSGRRGHSAVIYNAKMYVFAGRNSSTVYQDLWAFDFSANTWSEITASSGYYRYGHRAVVYTDAIYFFGGIDDSGNYKRTLITYDFSGKRGTWSSVDLAVTERAYCALAVDSAGCLYIVGGYNGSYLQSLIKYDMPNDDLYVKATPPDDRAFLQAVYCSE